MDHATVATFSQKVKPGDINFNGCNYRNHGRVKHNRTTVRVISRDVIGQSRNQLYKLSRRLSHLLSINSPHWVIILGGGVKIPSESRKPPTKLNNQVSRPTASRA